MYLCTDLNPHAARCTALTGRSNSVPLNPVLTDLTSALLPRLTHAIDVLVFNPPYVETEDAEAFDAQEDGVIERAWAGGIGGMRVTNRLLEQVEVRALSLLLLCEACEALELMSNFLQTLLSPRGVFYLVAVPENKPLQIIEDMKERGLTGEVRRSLSLYLSLNPRERAS